MQIHARRQTRTSSDDRVSPPQVHRLNEMHLNALPMQINRCRILCVDDEVIGSEMLGEVLRDHGYDVLLYHCPFAALRCDLSIVELAILDFQMPGLNGRELLLRFRASGARFPILMMKG